MDWVTWTLQIGLAALLGLFYHHLKSYMDAKARTLASKEDFDTLRDQTSRLTRDTEEIKAQVSDGQIRWNLKVQAYTKLLELLGGMQSTVMAMERVESLRRQFNPDSEPSQEAHELLRRHEELGAEITRTTHSAALVLPNESMAVLADHCIRLGELAQNRPADDLEWISLARSALADSIGHFLHAARSDLGFDDPSSRTN